MADRPKLTLARASRRTTLTMVKKAIRLFRHPGVPKDVYRANARKWLKSMQQLGANHLLRGGCAKWGQPGEPRVDQVFAPRRMGQA